MHPRPFLPFGRHGEDARPLASIKNEKNNHHTNLTN